MPYAAPRMCTSPGCGNLQPCKEHVRERRASDTRRRGNSSQRGYDITWQRLRVMVLHAEPLCHYCFQRGLIVPATTVDHMTPISRGGARLDRANLCGACFTCNYSKGSKTADEFYGGM